MQNIHFSSEQYTDRGHYAVMTRTKVLKGAQPARIADHLRLNSDDLTISTIPPTFANCRIAAAMVTWAFRIEQLRMESELDY